MPWAGGGSTAFVNPVSTAPAFVFDGRDGLIGYANAAAIGTWADQSGNARDATAAGVQRPTKTTLNGFPAALFDASDDNLVASGWSLTQPNTIFVVAGPFTGAYIFDSANAGARELLFNSVGTINAFAGSTVAAGAAPTAVNSLWAVQFNGVSTLVRRNGAQVGSGSGGAQALTGITIGSRVTITQSYGGAIACVLGYNALLSGADISAVETYLNARYGAIF